MPVLEFSLYLRPERHSIFFNFSTKTHDTDADADRYGTDMMPRPRWRLRARVRMDSATRSFLQTIGTGRVRACVLVQSQLWASSSAVRPSAAVHAVERLQIAALSSPRSKKKNSSCDKAALASTHDTTRIEFAVCISALLLWLRCCFAVSRQRQRQRRRKGKQSNDRRRLRRGKRSSA